MAFTTIPSSWLVVGEAIKQRLFTRIKDDLDDHETRINTLEAQTAKTAIFDDVFVVSSLPTVNDIILHYTVLYPMTISDFKLKNFVAAGTGSITIDLLKGTSLNSGSATSMLTTTATINVASGNYQTNSAVLDATKVDLVAGDVLFIKILAFPTNTNNVDKFQITALGV